MSLARDIPPWWLARRRLRSIRIGPRPVTVFLYGPPRPAADCSVYICDVAFYGAGASAYFQWETSQACSGS